MVIMAPIDGKSRPRIFERNVELELEPLELRDTIGLTLIFACLCVVSCGGVLFILGGGAAFGLIVWWLQPHKALTSSQDARFDWNGLARSMRILVTALPRMRSPPSAR
jgi:hypothetical protein